MAVVMPRGGCESNSEGLNANVWHIMLVVGEPGPGGGGSKGIKLSNAVTWVYVDVPGPQAQRMT